MRRRRSCFPCLWLHSVELCPSAHTAKPQEDLQGIVGSRSYLEAAYIPVDGGGPSESEWQKGPLPPRWFFSLLLKGDAVVGLKRSKRRSSCLKSLGAVRTCSTAAACRGVRVVFLHNGRRLGGTFFRLRCKSHFFTPCSCFLLAVAVCLHFFACLTIGFFSASRH